VKTASESSTSAADFSNSYKEIGAAFIGPNLGSALFQRTVDGSHPAPTAPVLPLTEQTVITTHSYFDSAGKTLAQDDSESFAEGGVLAVEESDMPKLVPENFKVEFEASDWDCSETEDFTMDTESSDFGACVDKFVSQFSQEDCSDTAYLGGVTAEGVGPVIDERASEEELELPPLPPPPPADAP
jgi:hypothetical protein